MSKRKKIIFGFILLLLVGTFFSNRASAKVKLDTVLTTNGLDEDGLPSKFKNVFVLDKDPAVQYYVNWKDDNRPHKVLVEWLGPQKQVINQLKLSNFVGNTVKSYISLEEKVKKQIVVPNQPGEYFIKLYIDKELIAITKFKLKEVID
ncbi:hypothetical protein [Sporohalobacter salinus]|uniref:hypothetical protein n=1 Tax=Sporohalobacter salinus TaxID=1494606 RepID=UPI00195F2F01|nr:hypothetical protein [Sporohalobacter salinus]MBM7624310.1 hypothetical protein [Sporohalobacter salinus]